jgi:hypothetical protein
VASGFFNSPSRNVAAPEGSMPRMTKKLLPYEYENRSPVLPCESDGVNAL